MCCWMAARSSTTAGSNSGESPGRDNTLAHRSFTFQEEPEAISVSCRTKPRKRHTTFSVAALRCHIRSKNVPFPVEYSLSFALPGVIIRPFSLAVPSLSRTRCTRPGYEGGGRLTLSLCSGGTPIAAPIPRLVLDSAIPGLKAYL